MKIISNGKKYIRAESDDAVIAATWFDKLGDNHGSGWEIQKLKKGIPFWTRDYIEYEKRRSGVRKFLKEKENLII